MGSTVQVFDFLHDPSQSASAGVVAVFGRERFLKKLAVQQLVNTLGGDEPDFSPTTFDADGTSWADVHDELSTRSLFGGDGPRVVIVDTADKFVKEYRDRIEDTIQPPTKGKKTKADKSPPATSGSTVPASVLILMVDSWAANTRLYKMVDKHGFQIKCDAPLAGRSKNVDEKRVSDWLIARSKTEYQFTLPTGGAQRVIDATDCDFGRMDQELQKLSLYADDKGKLDQETINQAVGGWRSRTMWEAIDAAVDGDAKKSLTLLDQLLRSGEHPLALFGQMSWSLKRYAVAAEIVLRQVRNGRKANMREAFMQAGFRNYGDEISLAERRIKQLGRERASRLMQWLIETDVALKLSHAREDRGRLVLENLFVKMAKELSP